VCGSFFRVERAVEKVQIKDWRDQSTAFVVSVDSICDGENSTWLSTRRTHTRSRLASTIALTIGVRLPQNWLLVLAESLIATFGSCLDRARTSSQHGGEASVNPLGRPLRRQRLGKETYAASMLCPCSWKPT
jgi:hypothetical protein